MPTLTEAKAHLRVDHTDEDALIQTLIDGAVHSVCDYLNVPTLPSYPAVEIAVLMLVGALYENRESVTDRPLSDNRLYDRLLAPYRMMEA